MSKKSPVFLQVQKGILGYGLIQKCAAHGGCSADNPNIFGRKIDGTDVTVKFADAIQSDVITGNDLSLFVVGSGNFAGFFPR